MFNKETFSKILINVYKSYSNQREFAEAAGVNRAYLSQYMNKKLDNPPTPKILMGIANASNYITTYDELMEVCGYFKNSKLSSESNIAKRIFEENVSTLEKYHISEDYLTELEKILIERNEDNDDIERQLNNFANYVQFEYIEEDFSIKDFFNDLLNINDSISSILERYNKAEYEYPIPLYEKIVIDKFGFLDDFDSRAIKYINLNINLEKISDLRFYFGLVTCDNSMSPLLDVGDIAIVHETTQYTSGNTYLLQINNNQPIIRKIIDTSGGLELHAMNMWNYPIQKVSISDIRIIGKVIRVENTSFFK